ncbi:hypothetical protein NIES2101_42175 [Calothrix sp. HK-06]|nr:hypothetical protein NIES2101_42175 [Calothrix sp. HK-06]
MAFKLLLFLGSVVCGFFLAADLFKITSPPKNVKLFWKKFFLLWVSQLEKILNRSPAKLSAFEHCLAKTNERRQEAEGRR